MTVTFRSLAGPVRPVARVAGLALTALCLVGFGPYRPAAAGFAALGSADALVASGTGMAALYANPAGMAQVREHTFELGGARAPADGHSPLYIGSVDATSSWGLAAGFGFSQDTDWTLDPDEVRRSGRDMRIGAAASLDGDGGRLLFGVAARRIAAEVQEFTGEVRTVAGWTGDAGVTVVLGSARLGAVLRNGLGLDAAEAPRRIASGIAYVQPHLVVEADGSWNTEAGSGPIYRVGGAWQPAEEGVQVRGGYVFDDGVPGRAIQHWVTGGLAWQTTRMGIGAAVAVDVKRSSAWTASLGLVWHVPYDL